MNFCKYANILGEPNKGIHKYRFMGVAIVDVIMTIALGLFIAHYFKKDKFKTILIFQDDIILRNNFINYIDELVNDLPKNTELVNIAFHKFASYNVFVPYDLNNCHDDEEQMIKKKINNNVGILNDTINPCSLGYLVTLEGAKNMVNYFRTYGFFRATDWNYNEYLLRKNIFYGSTRILATGDPNLGSDIFT